MLISRYPIYLPCGDQDQDLKFHVGTFPIKLHCNTFYGGIRDEVSIETGVYSTVVLWQSHRPKEASNFWPSPDQPHLLRIDRLGRSTQA